MELLDDYSLYNILISSRPSEYARLVNSNSKFLNFIFSNIYRLLKYWSNDTRSVAELEIIVPHLTIKQLSYIADYYRPTSKYNYRYPKLDLFNNALLNNDIKTAEALFKDSPHYIISAFVLGHSEYSYYNADLVDALQGTRFSNDIVYILGHRHASVKMFLDVLYKLHTVNPDDTKEFVQVISTGAYDKREYVIDSLLILNASQHPDVIDFCRRINVTYKPYADPLKAVRNILHVYHTTDVVGAVYHSGIIDLIPRTMEFLVSDDYSRIMVIMSQYDSNKYPSYDLYIKSGLNIEVIAKVNTWPQVIELEHNNYRGKEFNNNSNYDSWTSEKESLPSNLDYLDTTLHTTGKILMDKHPAIAVRYLNINTLSVVNNASNYYTLLKRWCFPNKNVTLLPIGDVIIPQILSCYYEPTIILGEWRGDMSVLIDRCLELGIPDERIMALLKDAYSYSSTRDRHPKPGEIINTCICLYVYGKSDMIVPLLDISRDAVSYSNTLLLDHIASSILFNGNSSRLNSRSLRIILNHTYLTAGEKLQFISKSEELDSDLLGGLAGDVRDNSFSIAGGILNMVLPSEDIINLLSIHNMDYQGKVTSIPYIQRQLDILANGLEGASNFPLGLLWRNTDMFRTTDSYTDDYITLVRAGEQSNIPLLNDNRYYEYLRGDKVFVPVGGFKCISKYGYTLANPIVEDEEDN